MALRCQSGRTTQWLLVQSTKEGGKAGFVPGNYVEETTGVKSTPSPASVSPQFVIPPWRVHTLPRSSSEDGEETEEEEEMEEEIEEEIEEGAEDGEPAVALYDFEGTCSDELTVQEDERLWIIEKGSEGWWKCRNEHGINGVVPASYLESTGGASITTESEDNGAAERLQAEREEEERQKRERAEKEWKKKEQEQRVKAIAAAAEAATAAKAKRRKRQAAKRAQQKAEKGHSSAPRPPISQMKPRDSNSSAGRSSNDVHKSESSVILSNTKKGIEHNPSYSHWDGLGRPALLGAQHSDEAIEALLSNSDALDPFRQHIMAPAENHEASCSDDKHTLFVHRSLARNLYPEALLGAEKVIELDPSSYRGYELKHAALHGAKRYGEAIEAFKIMLSKLDDTSDARIQKLRQQYVSPSEVEDAIKKVIDTRLENAPLRVLNTFTGRLCDQEAQINAFKESTEYTEILSSSTRAPLQTEPIKEAVAKYFTWAMLSHRWEGKEPRLYEIQDKDVYTLDAVGTVVKLQKFCQVARDAGHRWAWSDTCCIDQNNNAELQRSVNSMFVWYRNSALTIVYLSDVPPSSKSGALADSTWNTRGWTVQEFLAPGIVLFYQENWTLYLNDPCPNHKESVTIMQELEHSTGIDARSLITFRPGMTGAREKLQWASSRVTTLQEDIAYSLFGIFGVHLNVIYGEMKQNALGRLLQEIIAHSGDISALDWVGQPSNFNSCLPAEIASYKAPPCPLPSLSEDEMQTSVATLRNTVSMESASKLYALLDNLHAPPVRRSRGQDLETCPTYEVKADGLQDMLIATKYKLIQFSRAKSTRQPYLLVRPWNRDDLELPDLAEEIESEDGWSEPESSSDDSLSGSSRDNEPADSESHLRTLRSIVRLGQPFGALLLAQQRGGEYKRIASDNNIIARVKDVASVHDMMNIRTLEIL
ncbi:hypothetical protein DFH29DRAFT_1074967 [Suillus ampliporus]|nr:hypothetical protein DFH29DRAFT_1074967 [Suillus ampliporus]